MLSREDACEPSIPDFLTGGGGVGALVCAHDWSASPLGAPETWPQSLRSVVGLLLASQFPMFVAWGPELGFLYNDPYAEILGAKHPKALGARFHDIWPEIWPDISPLIDAAMAGDAIYRENLPLTMNRRGFDEQAWFTFSYSPVRDESGAVAGMFCVAAETTAQVLGERRRDALLKLDDRLRDTADTAELSFVASELLGQALGAVRVGYGVLDPQARTIAVERSWSAPGFPDVAGVHHFSSYGTYIDELLGGRSVAIGDVQTDPRTAAKASAFRALGARAFLDVPVLENGRPVGQMFVHSATPRVWTEEDVTFVHDFAERTRAAIARRTAENALQESDDRQSFLLSLTDALRPLTSPADIAEVAAAQLGERLGASRVLYAEIAGSRMTVERDYTRGVKSIVGEHDLEAFGPELLRAYHECPIVKVDDVGTDERFSEEARAGLRARQVGAYLDVILFEDEKCVALLAVQSAAPRAWTPAEARLIEEAGERLKSSIERARAEAALRENEARLGFLDRLGAETAALAEADAVLAVTTRLLVEHLNLSVCAYADMDEDENGFTIRGDWAAPGAKSIVGHYSLADFGKLAVANLSAGLPLVVNDNLLELAPEEAATFQSIGIAATICMPLVKDGRLTALMAVHDRVPRMWTKTELGLLREVTARSWAHVERVGAVAELRDSEARLKLALEAGRLAEVTFHLPEQVVHSASFAELLGHAPDKRVTLAEFRAQYHPDDHNRVIAERAAILESGQDFYEVEKRIVRPDGQARWVYGRGSVERDEQGRALSVTTIYLDETERKMAEIALRESEARLREMNETLEQQIAERTAERDRIWQLSPDLMCVARTDGTLVSVNPAWERMLGWPTEWLTGRNASEIKHPDDAERTAAELGKLAAGFGTVNFEDRYRHRNGSWRWISWVIEPEGELIYCIGRNVTAEKERQTELQQAQEALRQSQKMESMGQLTGGVAHDFNNLLTPIIGSLDLLHRKRLGSGREQRLIDGALQSAERARLLVQRLLAFARRQPLQPKPVDLGALVSGMADLVASTTGPQIKVVVDIADHLPAAIADPNQVEMAILNLSVNARDAMEGGGTLRLSAESRAVGAGHLSGLRPGQYVRLSVADTGTGMDEATLARATEPFFSTKGVGRGTGLGLSMVHGLASQLGGALTIQSRPGLGTNVEIWLPASDADVSHPSPANDATPRAGATGTALLVDDEELVRASTADMLSDLGYDVVEASSGEEALQLLDKGLEPDLLVSDHLMPGMTGTELAREVRARRPGTRLLLVSGYAEVDGIAADLPRLTKPYRQADLVAKLEELDEAPAR